MPRSEAREGILRIDRSQRLVNPSRKIRIKKPHPEGWDDFTQVPMIRAAQLISEDFGVQLHRPDSLQPAVSPIARAISCTTCSLIA